MAKESGIGFTCTVDDASDSGKNISNDISDLQFATPRNEQETTGLDKSAVERLLLLADFSITMNGLFNDESNLSHEVFKTIPSTSVARTVVLAISGQTLTAGDCFLTDYALTRAATGELTWTVPGVKEDGAVPSWS